MNHLPKLSMGVRRTSSIAGAKLGRGIAAAQEEIHYGNYCGPFYGDGTGCTEAMDEVDAVCCQHDVCIHEHGYNHCECHCDLIKNMPGAIADELAKGNTIGADAGLKIMTELSIAPCFCVIEIETPWPLPNIPIPAVGVGCISPCT